jgi:hypothetical protein
MALSSETLKELRSHLKERKVPRSLRSKLLGDVLGIESEREQGTFTASETGAKRAANERAGIRNMKAVGKAAQDTKSFEDYIAGKGKD